MLQDLLDENIKWVDKQKALDPEYFEKQSGQNRYSRGRYPGWYRRNGS